MCDPQGHTFWWSLESTVKLFQFSFPVTANVCCSIMDFEPPHHMKSHYLLSIQRTGILGDMAKVMKVRKYTTESPHYREDEDVEEEEEEERGREELQTAEEVAGFPSEAKCQ